MRAHHWRKLRQGVQTSALLLFLALFIYANAQGLHRLWADLLARTDPLLTLSASLAGRSLTRGLVLSGIVLILTLAFGRVWCGWLCPMGTMLEWIGPRSSGKPAPADGWRAAKVLLAAAILSAALFGNLTLTVLDPVTILNRTMATALWPGLRFAVTQTESVLYRIPVLWPALDAIHAALVRPLFQDLPASFALAPWTALLFAVLVGLNWRAERFWCRYLCPLGGLLGLVSKLSLVRRSVSADCTGCGLCAGSCPTGTIDANDGFRSDPAECTVCLDCLTECPSGKSTFRLQIPGWRPGSSRGYEPSRRQFLAVLGASAAGVALTSIEPASRQEPSTVIRPPGADMAALCVRCGACLRVCPTQGLQPTLFEAGVQNLLTPRLAPRTGYCDYGCTACSQVCPTGAIAPLTLAQKQQTQIGLASIDRDRCLPWAYHTACIVCEETCPVPDKAIRLEVVEVANGLGEMISLQRPRVIRELCIGCGVCEFKCPVEGEAAVQVHALKQSRLQRGGA